MEPVQSLVKLPQSMESTTTSAAKRPPMPDPISCAGGCDVKMWPEFIPPVTLWGQVMKFSNRWHFPEDMCANCQGKKYQEQQAKIQSRIMAEREERLKKLLTPKGYDDYHFDRFQISTGNGTALKACQNFDHKKENLYLWGAPGTGKSHLALATLRFWYLKGISPYLVSHSALNRQFQGLLSDDYDALLSEYVNCPLLVVDDLGTAKQTEFANQVLYEIIQNRLMQYRHGMIVTSNLFLDDLVKKLGDDRLTSRMAQLFRIIKIEGKDYRLER